MTTNLPWKSLSTSIYCVHQCRVLVLTAVKSDEETTLHYKFTWVLQTKYIKTQLLLMFGSSGWLLLQYKQTTNFALKSTGLSEAAYTSTVPVGNSVIPRLSTWSVIINIVVCFMLYSCTQQVILTCDSVEDACRQPALPSKEINTHCNGRAVHVGNTCRHVSLQRRNERGVAWDNTEITVCSQQQLQLRVIHGRNVCV